MDSRSAIHHFNLLVEADVSSADETHYEDKLAATCEEVVFWPAVWADGEKQHQRHDADEQRHHEAEECLLGREDEEDPPDEKGAADQLN